MNPVKPGLLLYYQTVHEKPMAWGYVSRLPQSVFQKSARLRKTLRTNQYDTLCREDNIRYVVTREEDEFFLSEQKVYTDENVSIYDLGVTRKCEYKMSY